MRNRKHNTAEKDEKPHKAAERVLAGLSQPVSTKAGKLDIDPDDPEESSLEKTMEDYYAKKDVEGQGGVPAEPPETDPMPLQDLRKPKGPPKHNM
jgi:hypothetical protein